MAEPDLALPIPAEWLDAIAAAVRERLEAEGNSSSPWMTRKQAADYLGVTA